MGERQIPKVLAANGLAIVGANGEDVPIKSQKAMAILAYVYLGPSLSAPREKLCGLLWSDSTEQTARAALRQCLRRLRVDLDRHGCPDLLHIERDRVVGSPDVEVDLAQTLRIISAGGTPKTVAEPSQILYGFDVLDPEFTAWMHVFRETWTDEQTRAIATALADGATGAGERIQLASLLFRIDPSHEPAAQVIIKGELDKGNLSGALKIYERLWDAVDEAWGEEPSQDLQAMIVMAKQGAAELSAPTPAPSTKPPIIFVEHFEQSGPWTQPTYLITGFRRELIASLVHFREWIIYDGDEGGRAKADYIVSAGYFDDGSEARVTVLLKDRTTGQCIVSETMELDFITWGEMLQRIVHKTALSLNLHLTRRRLSGPAVDEAGNFDAYDLWLKANEIRTVWRKDTYVKAEALLNEVVAKAPEYAPALSALAGLLNTRHLSEIGVRRSPERARRARELARRSVAIDPLDGRNHHALAWANAMDGAYGQAELHFELSVDLNPTSPRTLMPCAQGLSFLGNDAEALRLTEKALDIHPTMIARHWGYVQSIYYLAGDIAKSLEAADVAGGAILDLQAWHAAALARAGAYDQAQAKMQAFLENARAVWSGEKSPSDEQIAAWLVHAFPIRRAKDAAYLREGFALAGLPV